MEWTELLGLSFSSSVEWFVVEPFLPHVIGRDRAVSWHKMPGSLEKAQQQGRLSPSRPCGTKWSMHWCRLIDSWWRGGVVHDNNGDDNNDKDGSAAWKCISRLSCRKKEKGCETTSAKTSQPRARLEVKNRKLTEPHTKYLLDSTQSLRSLPWRSRRIACCCCNKPRSLQFGLFRPPLQRPTDRILRPLHTPGPQQTWTKRILSNWHKPVGTRALSNAWFGKGDKNTRGFFPCFAKTITTSCSDGRTLHPNPQQKRSLCDPEKKQKACVTPFDFFANQDRKSVEWVWFAFNLKKAKSVSIAYRHLQCQIRNSPHQVRCKTAVPCFRTRRCNCRSPFHWNS